jgi:signal transduction histidine kinase
MLTLAHDVRAPLTAIQTTLELLADQTQQLPAADRDRLLALSLRQSARIRRLATELIELERIEAGQLSLQLADLPARQVIEEALEHAGVTGGVVRVDPPGLRIRADPVRLDQVLVNLAGNARRHGRPPIEVAAEQADGTVRFIVRDHGAGIRAVSGRRVFQRFSADDQGPDSVGLGLWVARQMVLAHGGEIRYEPAEPGARFVFTLPVRDGPGPDRRGSPDQRPGPDQKPGPDRRAGQDLAPEVTDSTGTNS